MGRKSSKGKEKRQRRKEDAEKLKSKQAVVDAANALEDPMAALLPFKKYERNGLSVTLTCCKVGQLDCDTVDWAFELVKENMQTLYEQSDWGWSDQQKKAEMEEECAWYLVARGADGAPLACTHFRFDLDNDDEVLYCYEIQLVKSVRRKGLGKFMMQILELIAHKAQMKKVMLTVFKHNEDAQNFFAKKLKYEVDETSPEESLVEAMFDDDDGYSYQILSKAMAPRKTATPVVKSPPQPQAQQLNGHSNTNGHAAASNS